MVDIFYKDNNIDAIRLVADNNAPPTTREAVVVDVSPVGTVGVRFVGTLNVTYHDALTGSKLEVGDRVRLVRSDNTKKWVVVGAYSASSAPVNTQAGNSTTATNYLGVPEQVTAEGVAGMIVFRWQTPGSRPDVFFELYVANDTAGTGAVTYKVSGTIYCLAIAAGTTKYAKVRTVDSQYNRSGFSDWVTATANATAFGNQNANTVYAGPTSGAAAAPAFRALANQDVETVTDQFACSHRLSLSSTAPVTTGTQTAKTVIYLVPYTGNRIAVYDGSAWHSMVIGTLNTSAAGWTAGLPYDIFLYWNSGTPGLVPNAWTNATTRATGLVYLDGRLVLSGLNQYLYLGTVVPYSTGNLQVSPSYCGVWNNYNRRPRPLYCVDGTTSWTYTTNAWRASNASTTDGVGRVSFVIGWAEDTLFAIHQGFYNQSSSQNASVGIGLDSTTVNSAQVNGGMAMGTFNITQAQYNDQPAAGAHYLQRLENSTAVGTTTWYGATGSGLNQTGMEAILWA